MIKTVSGSVIAQGQVAINISTSGRPLRLQFTILHTDNVVPPLVAMSDLPAFSLDSKRTVMTLEDGREIQWGRRSQDRLLRATASFDETQEHKALLTTDQKSKRDAIIRELHREAGHPPARNLHAAICNLAPKLVRIKDIVEATKRCRPCLVMKDNRHRSTPTKETKELDMAGVDIIHFNPPSDGYVAVILVRHRLTRMFSSRMIKSHREEDIAAALKEIFGNELPLPTAVRVDGEKGFTVRVSNEITRAGVVAFQTTPPYRHTANGYAENANKRFIEALR